MTALAILIAGSAVTFGQPRASAAGVPMDRVRVFDHLEGRELVAFVAAASTQMVLIMTFLLQRSRRHIAKKTLLASEAQTRYGRTRQLAGDLIHAQEAARIALAQDLHDDICQDIVGIAMSINDVTLSSGRIQDPKNQYALAMLHRSTIEVANHVRLISHELHPVTLQLLGLIAAVNSHCLEVEARYQTHVALHTAGDMKNIPANIALCLFRVVQESLRNAAVHGRARHVEVSLTRFGDDVELAIRDDGCGFDVDSARRDSPGLGLVSMTERVHAIGGEVLAWSKPGEGTTVTACVPVGGPPQIAVVMTPSLFRTTNQPPDQT